MNRTELLIIVFISTVGTLVYYGALRATDPISDWVGNFGFTLLDINVVIWRLGAAWGLVFITISSLSKRILIK